MTPLFVVTAAIGADYRVIASYNLPRKPLFRN